jgi:hypothetical protein
MPAIADASGLSFIALAIAAGIGDGIIPMMLSPALWVPLPILLSPELLSCVKATPPPDWWTISRA